MIQELQEIGLTAWEAKAYAALISLGQSKVSALLKESAINTGKIYEVLESLKRKGLVSEAIINNVKHYSPSGGENLIQYIQSKKIALIRQEEVAKNIASQINLNVKPRESNTKTYIGFEGFKSGVNEATEMLKKGGIVRAMGIQSNKQNKFNNYWKHWSEKIQISNPQKVLTTDFGEHYDNLRNIKNVQVKVMKEFIPSTIDIFGEEVVLIFQYSEPVTTIAIYDKRVAKSFITFFEQLWDIAKE